MTEDDFFMSFNEAPVPATNSTIQMYVFSVPRICVF